MGLSGVAVTRGAAFRSSAAWPARSVDGQAKLWLLWGVLDSVKLEASRARKGFLDVRGEARLALSWNGCCCFLTSSIDQDDVGTKGWDETHEEERLGEALSSQGGIELPGRGSSALSYIK